MAFHVQYLHRETMLTLLRHQRVLASIPASSVLLLSEAIEAPKINRRRAAAILAFGYQIMPQRCRRVYTHEGGYPETNGRRWTDDPTIPPFHAYARRLKCSTSIEKSC